MNLVQTAPAGNESAEASDASAAEESGQASLVCVPKMEATAYISWKKEIPLL